jgi:predicted enzyme related to lactoylglutathione lyase
VTARPPVLLREDPAMQKVNGIGGFFFTASDPDALGEWYREHLGIERVPQSYDAEVWCQTEGPTVFAPFGADGDGVTPVGPRGWGINFRVDDLDAMAAQLRAAGLEVDVDATVYPNGRFATLADPDGNPVQLWQPA